MGISHDSAPPPRWPPDVVYLTKSRLSPKFPSWLKPLVDLPKAPCPTASLCNVNIKRITEIGHPARGQSGLFASRKIKERTLIISYMGLVHASIDGQKSIYDESDYDLSLLRVAVKRKELIQTMGITALEGSSTEDEYCIIDIGIDAATHGNAARMCNDFRGVPAATRPNAEFRQVVSSAKPISIGHTNIQPICGMQIWSLEKPIAKGEEILLSYGRSFWSCRGQPNQDA